VAVNDLLIYNQVEKRRKF